MKLKMFGKMLVLRSPFQLYSMPSLQTWGLTNKVGSKYFLMLDYDSVDYDVVVNDIKYLQANFGIGTVVIRISSMRNYKDTEVGSYHVYGFRLYDFPTVKKLISLSRCDSSFKGGYSYQARCWVLRIGAKVANDGSVAKPFTLLRDIVGAKTNGTACSALVDLFERLDGVRFKHYFKNLDDSKQLEFIRYATR